MNMRRKDFISGIVLFCVGAAFFVASLRLPWLDSGYNWHGAPGIVPAILAALLMLTGLRLVFRSRTNPKFYEQLEQPDEHELLCDFSAEDEPIKDEPAPPAYLNSEVKRALLVVLLCSIYVFGFLGKIPYLAATAIFLGAFMFIFKGAGIIKTLFIAGIASMSIWFVFYKIFAVFLP